MASTSKKGLDTLYRSPQLPRRCFRTPGRLHLHLDARDQVLLESLGIELQQEGARSKLNVVRDTVRGSEWREAVFEPHSSSGEGAEYFLSLLLKDREQCIHVVRRLLSAIAHVEGVVLEVERVIALYDLVGVHLIDGKGPLSRIDGKEVGFEPVWAPPIEIHSCFEIKADAEPLDFDSLPVDLSGEGLDVGTWARFERGPQCWSYRSTAFIEDTDVEERCLRAYRSLDSYLTKRALIVSGLWVIAEEVLGLWKQPFTKAVYLGTNGTQ